MPSEYGGHWRVTKEQIKKYLPNAYYCFFYGALGSLFPFLNLYYRSIGLGPLQIGVLGGLRPLVALFSGPLWCHLSNKCKIRKLILLASLISWVAFTLPLGFPSHAQASNNCLPKTGTTLGNKTRVNTSLSSQVGRKRELTAKRLLLTNGGVTKDDFTQFIRSKPNYLTKGNGDESLRDFESNKDYVSVNKRSRIARDVSSKEKKTRNINLEKPFVNSFNTFGIDLHKHPYTSKRKPYDFKSRHRAECLLF